MKKKVVLKFIGHELQKDLWNSKKELFNNFMGDFYDFILEKDGKEDLENENVYTLPPNTRQINLPVYGLCLHSNFVNSA